MASVQDIEKLIRAGHTVKAVEAAKAATRRRPKDLTLLDATARAYSADGQPDKAVAIYDRLARAAPRSAKPFADKGHLLQMLGRTDEANRALRTALKLMPLNGSLVRMLSVSDRVSPTDPAIKGFVEAWNQGTLPAEDRIEGGFGLSKAFGDEGFAYLCEANRLQRKAAPWSRDKRHLELAALKHALSTKPWAQPSADLSAMRPIFVTGVPRSGTTLVEQIISSHPDVAATGETGLTLRAAYSVLRPSGGFRDVTDLTQDEMALMGRRYLEGMAHFHKVSGVFTDKSIQTYLVMGLLHHIMPNARTIVVRRDPRDTGWSIYRNHFATGTHGYSNDLGDIGHYIRMFEDMLAFWRAERPEAFFEVSYDALVHDPEPHIRAIIDYCGLAWDPTCLEPEKNTRAVQTLSIDQVRSPISPASVGGWRKWAKDLDPLITALGDLVDEWD